MVFMPPMPLIIPMPPTLSFMASSLAFCSLRSLSSAFFLTYVTVLFMSLSSWMKKGIENSVRLYLQEISSTLSGFISS